MRMLVCAAALFAACGSLAAAEISSVYTDLDLEKGCSTFSLNEEGGEFANLACNGWGGYPVLIAGRTEAKLAQTAQWLRAGGATVGIAVGDASRREDADRFVAAAQALAPLALAVHNAGSNQPADFLEVSEERFTRHWRDTALRGFPELKNRAFVVKFNRLFQF